MVLSACGGAADSGGIEDRGRRRRRRSRDLAWAGYIERGETDPAYDWVTEFENETHARSR